MIQSHPLFILFSLSLSLGVEFFYLASNSLFFSTAAAAATVATGPPPPLSPAAASPPSHSTVCSHPASYLVATAVT